MSFSRKPSRLLVSLEAHIPCYRFVADIVPGIGCYKIRRSLVSEKGNQKGEEILNRAFEEVGERLESCRVEAQESLKEIPYRVVLEVRTLLEKMIQEIRDIKMNDSETLARMAIWKAEVHEIATAWKNEWMEPRMAWTRPNHSGEVPNFADEPMLDVDDDSSDSDSDSDDELTREEEEVDFEDRDVAMQSIEPSTPVGPRVIQRSAAAAQAQAGTVVKLEQLD